MAGLLLLTIFYPFQESLQQSEEKSSHTDAEAETTSLLPPSHCQQYGGGSRRPSLRRQTDLDRVSIAEVTQWLRDNDLEYFVERYGQLQA